MHGMREAAELAGQSPSSGFCTKAEARQDVRDRIAFLADEDVQVLREGKREVEAFLWKSIRNDISQYFDIVERTDSKGRTYVDQVLKPFDAISPEARQLIEGLTYTEKGKPQLKIVGKLAASNELRKLKGLDAPTKTDATVTGGAVIHVVTGVPRAPNEPEAS
jgi:hypothetical protein